jgi:hypothetical protein
MSLPTSFWQAGRVLRKMGRSMLKNGAQRLCKSHLIATRLGPRTLIACPQHCWDTHLLTPARARAPILAACQDPHCRAAPLKLIERHTSSATHLTARAAAYFKLSEAKPAAT